MTNRQIWCKLHALIRNELTQLVIINSSDRPWLMPFCAALASALPLLIGAYFDHLNYGLVSSLGGFVFLYSPNTPLSHRMVTLMKSAFGMSACYALGLISHFSPFMIVPVLTFITIVVTMVCRLYVIGPPGSLFFILSAAIGAYSPIDVVQMPLFVGLLTMGCLLACLIAFFYSLYSLRHKVAQPVSPSPPATFDFVIVDSVVIGAFVGIALALAQSLQLERSYWVLASCLGVMQGASRRAVWNKQVHRIIGTGVGLCLSWGLLTLSLDPWSFSLMIMVLAFVIETLIVRHYGLAVIFITPLTIFIAESTLLRHGSPDALLLSRLIDTVLGSVLGLIGGICLHSPLFRDKVGQQLRRLSPAKFFR